MKRTRRLASLFLALTVLLGVRVGTAHADLLELKWSSEGYFRTRSVFLTNLAPMPRVVSTYPPTGDEVIIPEIRRTSYLTSRLRIMPKVALGKIASLTMQIDALDNVLWGDNNAIATAPLFALDASNQHFLGGKPGASVNVTRAWMDFMVPIGSMRVGRMAAHWGLGLLANGGGTANYDSLPPATPKGEPKRKSLDHFFDDDFGDNHYGATADRILFLTKPGAIAKTIRQGSAKVNADDHSFVIGYGYSKLAEAPLLRAEGFERQFRPFQQQGFISRGKNDDVQEHVFIAVYNDAEWNKTRITDELRVGGYMVIRTATEGSTQPSDLDPNENCGAFDGQTIPCVDTGSTVYIADFWWRMRLGALYTEGEIVKIFGTTFGGVPFPSKNRKKEADILGGVARVGYLTEKWDAILEVGHASGDDELEDQTFKQRALNPDFNVGLILFEETLRELSARTFGPPFFSSENPEGATGLMSKGGVINANYIFPKARYLLPFGGFEVIGGILFAWVDTLARTGTAMFYADENPDSTYLGTEFDVSLRTSFAQGHMLFAVQGGYLMYGDVLKSRLPNADSSFTIQTKLAFMW